MRIVVWIGKEPNQCALANKINEHFNLVGVVMESRQVNRKFTIKKIIEKIIEKIFLGKIDKAWLNMQATMQKSYPYYPSVSTINIENVNSEEVYNFTNELNPDLIVVSGTRLVKEKLLSLQPTIGILNLHTGLSPYIKGGPNCTNWCIATNQFHLIGNTIMWIDLGIDTGNILATKCLTLTGKEDFNELHLKVMNEAHQLYVDSIKSIEQGHKQSVPQKNIAEGTTYYTRQWGLKQKFSLVRNFKNWDRSGDKLFEKRKQENIIEISLPQ